MATSHTTLQGDLYLKQTRLSITDTRSQDRQYIKQELKLARQALHNIQKKADIMRTTHLEDLAIYKAENSGTTASVEIRKLLHIEAVRKTAKNHG